MLYWKVTAIPKINIKCTDIYSYPNFMKAHALKGWNKCFNMNHN